MRTAYVAEVLKDGHLSFPNDVRKKLHLHEGMKIKVTIEGAEKAVKEVKNEAALKYLFSQLVVFSSCEDKKEGLITRGLLRKYDCLS